MQQPVHHLCVGSSRNRLLALQGRNDMVDKMAGIFYFGIISSAVLLNGISCGFGNEKTGFCPNAKIGWTRVNCKTPKDATRCKAYYNFRADTPEKRGAIYGCGKCTAGDDCCLEGGAYAGSGYIHSNLTKFDQHSCLFCLSGADGKEMKACPRAKPIPTVNDGSSPACVVYWENGANVYDCATEAFCFTRGACCRMCTSNGCNNAMLACLNEKGGFRAKRMSSAKSPDTTSGTDVCRGTSLLATIVMIVTFWLL